MITEISNNYKSDFLRIEYMLGNTCNHKCSYCFPNNNEGTFPWPDVALVKENLGHLLDHYQSHGKNTFQFYLVGGEPTIWKDLPDLTAFLKDNYNAYINVSTNASRSLNWWIDNADYYDNIEISVHHEFADIDHIIKVADMIYDRKRHVVANVLMDPDHFEKCKDIVEQLKTSKNSWGIIAKSVLYNGQTRYTEEQKEYFNPAEKRAPNLLWYIRSLREPEYTRKVYIIEDGFKKRVPNDSWIMLNDLNHFRGWTCNLGVDFLEIYQDGTISGNCRQRVYGVDHFNLYDQEFIKRFSPEIKPIICQKDTCECSSEVAIKKYV